MHFLVFLALCFGLDMIECQYVLAVFLLVSDTLSTTFCFSNATISVEKVVVNFMIGQAY